MNPSPRIHRLPLLLAAVGLLRASPAGAADTSAPPEAPLTQPKAPYSLPFQLRPVVAATVLRSDTALAFYEAPTGAGGTTVATTLLGSYKVTERFAPLVRLGLVSNAPPAGESATGLLNPVVGATYAVPLGAGFKLGAFLGVTLPVGSGGGDAPSLAHVTANGAGMRARSALDNAMFAVNDLTVFPGVGLAYVAHGLTVQGEVTLLELVRVRGADVQPDATKTNLTSGVHVGYFLAKVLSAAVELRHQRWLSTPTAIEANAGLRDTTTLAFGPRLHLALGRTSWFRPAVALVLPVDDPLADAKYRTVQLDLPVSF